MSKSKLKNFLVLSSFFLFIVAFFIIGRLKLSNSDSESPQVKRKLVMGSLAKIKMYSTNHTSSLWDTLFNTIYSLDTLTNFYSSNSQLYEFNRADKGTIRSFPRLKSLIDSAFKYAREIRGSYNPAIGPLSRIWHRNRQEETLPSKSEIDSALAISRLQFFSPLAGNKIYKKSNEARLDLGGIAKGYAVERVARRIEEDNGDYLIDIGGTIKAASDGKKSWKIGIRHPREPGEFIATFHLPDGYSCSTAGDYQQYFIKDSVRYHHIIDPQTGYPVRNALASVTLISENAIAADALATGLFVLGLDDAKKFVEKNPDYEAIFIFQKEKNLYIQSTGNLKVSRLKS